jgi:hypothetical protein
MFFPLVVSIICLLFLKVFAAVSSESLDSLSIDNAPECTCDKVICGRCKSYCPGKLCPGGSTNMCGCEWYGGCAVYVWGINGDEDACGFRQQIPTTAPTTAPIPDPTLIPTTTPSLFPTKAAKPTRHPTLKPSLKPSKRPSKRPTAAPSPHRRTKAPKTDKPTRKSKE